MALGPMEMALILMVLLFSFIVPIVAIWVIVRVMFRKGSSRNANSLARARYAKGEISKAEFEEIKQAINK